MIGLRLLADDLTGALDTAAELVGVAGTVHAYWHGALPAVLEGNAALDSGTRELPPERAAGVVAGLTAHLEGGAIAYKKIDSLLRGPTLAELAACFRAGPWERAVLAPAFPFQGRVTRDGRQYARDAERRWTPVGGDIVAALRAHGVPAQMGVRGAALEPGISVFDAETEWDLQRVVETGRRAPGPILWSGTGGLAQALADGKEAAAAFAWPGPVLGLFGSDQAVTAAQLAACGALWLRLPDDAAGGAPVRDHISRHGTTLASFELPTGLSRVEAARRIEAAMNAVIRDLPRPGTLLVAGGETLRSLCTSLGAQSLEIEGRIVPGVPRSTMRGGRWDGVSVVSKSGAFGHANLLRDLLRSIEASVERTG